MLVKAYTDLTLRTDGPYNRRDLGVDKFVCAHFRLDNDVSRLFPYINGVAPSATFMEKPPYIRFMLDGFLCGLHPHQGVAALFEDRDQALEFLERLLVFLNDLDLRRNSLKPNYKSRRAGKRSASRHRRGTWPQRFWKHAIRDEADYERHVDYLHYNPVKQGRGLGIGLIQASTVTFEAVLITLKGRQMITFEV